MNKKIIITGIAAGLGRALLGEFTKLGHLVFGCDSSFIGIEKLQNSFAYPERFRNIDVCDQDQVQAWASEISEVIVPDLLINNAGYTPEMLDFCNLPAMEFNRAISVNVIGVANVARAFLPYMKATNNGVLVNFSGRWGRIGAAKASAFCASKWAIEGLTQAISLELPSGMAAVTYSPGAVYTDALIKIHGNEKAASFTTPECWSITAAQALLAISPSDNGAALG